MRIYSVLAECPDLWQGEGVDEEEITAMAHAYVWELFKMCETMQHRIFWHDFNELLGFKQWYFENNQRNAYSSNEKAERRTETNYIAAMEMLATYIVRYLKEYGFCFDRGEVAQLYEIQKEAAAFLDASEWPTMGGQEDFKAVRYTEPRFNKFDDKTAKAMYEKLVKNNVIQCEESTFLWYFGQRVDKAQPQRIKIANGILKKEFALLCECLNIKAQGFKTYEQINISSAIEEGKRQTELKYMAAAMKTEENKTPVIKTTGKANETKATPWEVFTQIFEADFKFYGKKGKCDLQQNLKNYQSNADTDKGQLIKQSVFAD